MIRGAGQLLLLIVVLFVLLVAVWLAARLAMDVIEHMLRVFGETPSDVPDGLHGPLQLPAAQLATVTSLTFRRALSSRVSLDQASDVNIPDDR